jgi:hypothetical protein
MSLLVEIQSESRLIMFAADRETGSIRDIAKGITWSNQTSHGTLPTAPAANT